MWPKALTQLVELAPHVTRLLPLADRYFKDKSAGDEATRKAIDDLQANHQAVLNAQRATVTDLSDRLHADLGALASQQTTQATQTAALGRQLATFEQQLTTLSRPIADLEKHLTTSRADALAAKQASEALDTRLTRIETTQRRTQTLTAIAVALLTATLILLIILSLHTR